MIILGIDPGYGITGFGLIESDRGQNRLLQCGAITTPAGADFSARLEMIYEDMRQLIDVCKGKITLEFYSADDREALLELLKAGAKIWEEKNKKWGCRKISRIRAVNYRLA